MPRYEYRCTDCLHRVIVQRPVDNRDDPLACPACEQPTERLIGDTPFVMEGKGYGKMWTPGDDREIF